MGRRQSEFGLDALQVADELERTLLTFRGVFAHAATQHRLERRRNIISPDRGQAGARDAGDEVTRLVRAAGFLERGSAGDERIEGRGQRPDLAGDRSGGLIQQDFRRGPGHGHPDGLPRIRRGPETRGDSEVAENGVPEQRRQDVGRLDVSVQHTALMGGLDGAADLHADPHRLGDRDALRAEPISQLRAAQLHDEIGPPIRRDARLVHREDPRVRRQLGHQVRLDLEHAAHALGDDVGKHDLHGHLAPRHVLLVEKDVGKATGTEQAHVREPGQDRRR